MGDETFHFGFSKTFGLKQKRWKLGMFPANLVLPPQLFSFQLLNLFACSWPWQDHPRPGRALLLLEVAWSPYAGCVAVYVVPRGHQNHASTLPEMPSCSKPRVPVCRHAHASGGAVLAMDFEPLFLLCKGALCASRRGNRAKIGEFSVSASLA